MNKNIKLFTTVIFFGSIWGILEATIGHILHFIPATIAGSIMFPIASLILYKTYKKTESKASLFYVGLVAAMIKSVDLLLPSLSVYKTINPMISILLESLVVVAVITLVISKKPQLSYSALPIASVSWRTIFIGYMGLQFVLTGNLAPYIKTLQAGITFVIIGGLLSGAMASLLLFVERNYMHKFNLATIKPIYAAFLFIAALITTYTL